MRRLMGTPRTPRGLRTAGIFAAIIAGYFILRSFSVIAQVFYPLEHGFVVLGTQVGNVTSRVLRSEQSTSALLAQCEDRLRTSTVHEAALQADAKSVAELETLLGYTQEANSTNVLAHVISRSLPDAATIALNKGQQDGITVGNAVVIGDGHLLGIVTGVTESSSIVRLTQSRESKIPAAILGQTRTIGLVEGQQGSVLHMQYIPEDAVIQAGDLVVTSGLEGSLPYGIVIGIVTNVTKEDTAPFLEALVEPVYDARTWTNVLVMTPTGV